MTLGDVKQGNIVNIAKRKWDVLGEDAAGILCLSHDIVRSQAFNVFNNNLWTQSPVRAYLNNKFLDELREGGGCEPNIHVSDLTGEDGLDDYGSCIDRVFLLTVDQYRKYRRFISRVDGEWWWLITPDSPINQSVCCVISDGTLYGASADNNHVGIRPACIFPKFLEVEENGKTYSRAETNKISVESAECGTVSDDGESVRSIIENVCDEMCNKYCKYNDQSYEAMARGEIFYMCDDCPLRRLF